MTSQSVSYKSTIRACYIGNFVQATVTNLTPILFIPLMSQFGLSFEQMGRLVLINFTTQVVVDLAFSRLVEKHGIRPFIVAAHVLAFFGFGLFAFAPYLFSSPYMGFVIATIIFSGSGGLLELLLSPIVNSIPTDEKAAAMSMLHSFYAWGAVTVILLTTLLIKLLGPTQWPIIVLFWCLIPFYNTYLFAKVPLAPPVPEEHRQPLRALMKKGFFLVCILSILAGGAAEVSMAQWASSFLDKAMGLPKVVGDTVGVCMFAIMLGVGRTIYGKYGTTRNVYKAMSYGSVISGICYLTVVFSPWPVLSVVACALTGLGVCLLWPGTIVVAADRYPLAGASMFAILAAGGDFGASIGPWLVGYIADNASKIVNPGSLGLSAEELGLRAGLLVASVFPIVMFLCVRYLAKKAR